VAELLAAAGQQGYLELTEVQRQNVLLSWLSREGWLPERGLTEDSQDVVDTLATLAALQSEMGTRACDTYIISMCSAPSHLLEVLLLARQSNLVRLEGGRISSTLQVRPSSSKSKPCAPPRSHAGGARYPTLPAVRGRLR